MRVDGAPFPLFKHVPNYVTLELFGRWNYMAHVEVLILLCFRFSFFLTAFILCVFACVAYSGATVRAECA